MKRNLLSIIVASIAFASATTSSFAWDSFGHMAVACVAYQKLTPAMQQRATQLLTLNPEFPTWSGWIPSGTSKADSNMMIFMLAATWPDEIKSMTNPLTGKKYVKDGSSGGNRPEGSHNASANDGYTDESMHKYWHFIDEPFTHDGSTLPKIPTPNAQERIALFRSTLASGSSDDLKSYDLAWLIHLVGDVHQPLHCTTRVSHQDPDGDNGGNLVAIGSSELHAFWDDLLGTGKDSDILKKVVKVAKKLPAPDQTQAANANEKDWVNESFQLAQSDVYVSPVDDGDGPFTLTTQYKANAKTIAQQRVAVAGARLANLINANLK